MRASIAEALAHAHPLFTAGIPHFPDREIIPIETAAHFIAFDVARVSPLYTMLQVNQQTAIRVVPRKDNFVSGHYTLPDELSTTEADYARWNQANPNRPLDKGHSAGSQYRRDTALHQSDIDTLAGVCPETPVLNRNVKQALESAIVDRAAEWTIVRLVQGPGWLGHAPAHGKLESGQWIPDFLWISSWWQHNKTIESWTWFMMNEWELPRIKLQQISLVELEELTGLRLWNRTRSDNFVKYRGLHRKGVWWRSGQPHQDEARAS